VTIPEIIELREIDEDFPGSVLGYYTLGHVDCQKIAIAINQKFDLASCGSYASVSGCRHTYARKVPFGNDGLWHFVETKSAGQVAFACTYCEVA
jgi:hypothetical protein